jgi:heme exporter protein A
LGASARLWILDEPFAALDAAAVTFLELLIARHVNAGGMAVLTTHQPLAVTAVTMLRIELDFDMGGKH